MLLEATTSHVILDLQRATPGWVSTSPTRLAPEVKECGSHARLGRRFQDR
jgi:hypothetical protein